MINMQTILTHSIIYALGLVTAYIVMKLKTLIINFSIINERLNDIEENVLTPEDMAKKILTMKMPVKDLPPEVIEQFRKEAEKNGEKPTTPNYMG